MGNGYEARQTSKEQNKEAKIYVGRSMTVHIFCFALMYYA